MKETHVGHLRGSAYPSKPGLTLMLFIKLRQLRHWIEMRVALQRIDEAAITMPGILTSWDTCSDYTNNMHITLHLTLWCEHCGKQTFTAQWCLRCRGSCSFPLSNKHQWNCVHIRLILRLKKSPKYQYMYEKTWNRASAINQNLYIF